MPSELVLAESKQSLGRFELEGNPQPGMHVNVDGCTYLVLERRHRYQLKLHQYELSQVLLSVKLIEQTSDRTWYEGRWVIGDIRCEFNARSSVIRCAVNPKGPCDRCSSFQFLPQGHI